MTRMSFSAREKYEQCPYKYYLHYVEGYRSSLQSSALCFGNALDVALNDMLSGNLNYHEVFNSEWEKYKNEKIEYYKSDLDISLLTKEETSLPIAYQNFISLQRKGIRLLDAYYQNIFPKIDKVISIQEEINLSGFDEDGNPTEDSIYGKIDLIAMIRDDTGKVHHALLDNKTTSEPYSKNAVQKKDQLALYACGYPEINSFGYLTMNKKNYKTQIILDTISEERRFEVLNKFVETLDKINNQPFVMDTRSCYSFGRRCEFYTHCHMDYFSEDIYQKKKEE